MKKLKQFDYVVLYACFGDVTKSVTVADVMEKYKWNHGRAQRTLDRLVKAGHIRRKSRSFWNGMFWAERFYYW